MSVRAVFPTVQTIEQELTFNEGWAIAKDVDNYDIEADVTGDSETGISVGTEIYYRDEEAGIDENASKTEIIVTKK